MSTCVVCRTSVEANEAHYANAWERSRKKAPCCPEACAKAFDPDVHWIPAALPKVVEGDEVLGDHPKTGQSWTPENRPLRSCRN